MQSLRFLCVDTGWRKTNTRPGSGGKKIENDATSSRKEARLANICIRLRMVTLCLLETVSPGNTGYEESRFSLPTISISIPPSSPSRRIPVSQLKERSLHGDGEEAKVDRAERKLRCSVLRIEYLLRACGLARTMFK